MDEILLGEFRVVAQNAITELLCDDDLEPRK